MKITITNTFHNSSVNVIVKSNPVILSESQVKRVEKALCGLDCACGSMWGNHTVIAGHENCHFEPIIDRYTGKTSGAELVEN